MPGFDRSGPMGNGAMTGGGRGFCTSSEISNTGAYAKGYARGRGCGRVRFQAGGYGRGGAGQFRFMSGPMRSSTPPDEMAYLTREAQNLERNLQTVKNRLNDLQNNPE